MAARADLLEAEASLPSPRAAPANAYVFHPNFIWRIGGEPAELMHGLSDGSAQAVLDRIDHLRAAAETQVADACAIIERLIPAVDDRILRRDALALKRDLFAWRPAKGAPDPRILALLDPAGWTAITDASRLVGEIHALEQSFVATFGADLLRSEQALPPLFERANVSEGLRAVNPNLHGALERHFGARRPVIGNKAERSFDTSFLQYFSRTALKTSPLSTFTPILVGSWRDEGSDDVGLDLPSMKLRRHVSLRRSLLLELLTGLLRPMMVLPDSSRLILNRSLRRVGTYFVANRAIEEPSLRAMTWGVGLEEVRFEASASLAMIIDIFAGVEPPGLTIAEFVRGVEGRLAPAQIEALAKAVFGLAKLGILQSDGRFTEQEDPIAHAIPLLRRADPDSPVADILARVQEGAAAYVIEPDPAARSAVARDIGAGLREVAAIAGKALSADIVTPFLYEDCQVEGHGVAMAETALGQVGADLKRLTAISPLFDMNATLQCWLATSFVESFGPDGVCDDPRAFLLAQMKEIDGGVIAPWTIASIGTDKGLGAELKRLKDEFFDHVALSIDGSASAEIDPAFMDRLAARLPEQIMRRPKSHCFFGQFFSAANGGRGFAINQILSGNSQLFARFIAGDAASVEPVAAYLRRTSRHGHFLEMSGAFGFNANLYPPIGQDDLAIAPYPANRREARRHQLDSLALRYDQATHRIYFSDEQGRPADIYYLGLLNPGLMPQLHRIVCGLSTQAPIFFGELSQAMRRNGLRASGASFVTPRVTLGSVVVQRRAWNVASGSLPDLGKLDAAEAFRAIHEWRNRLDLPRRGFIRFAPSTAQLMVAGTDESDFDWVNFDRTKLKPFYVDFTNPLLARQFTKVCKSTRFDAILQEPLPDIDDQNLTVDGKGHVAELQVELSAVCGDVL